MRSCTTRRWGQQGFCSQGGRVTCHLHFPAISGRLRLSDVGCVVRSMVPVCVGRPWFTVEPKVKGGSLEGPPLRAQQALAERFLCLTCVSEQVAAFQQEPPAAGCGCATQRRHAFSWLGSLVLDQFYYQCLGLGFPHHVGYINLDLTLPCHNSLNLVWSVHPASKQVTSCLTAF